MIEDGLSKASSGYTVSVQCFFPFVNNRQAQTGALVPFHLPTIHGSGSHPFPLSISLDYLFNTFPVHALTKKAVAGKGAFLAQWGRCTDGLLRLSGRACIGTVFRSGSFEFGISLFGFFTFTSIFPGALFSGAGNW